VQLQNSAGNFVQPSQASFKAAALGAEWKKSFYQILTNQPGAQAWPITSATFILMHKTQEKPAQAAASLAFFAWAYKNGDKLAEDLDYVPMPEEIKTVVMNAWRQIADASGKPVGTK
jgi:phosphate transport system substrate-binding protein